MTKEKQQSHPDFSPENVAPHAIVVGDPKRAADAANLLENPKEVWRSREYWAFTGSYREKLVTICSHGVGSAGATYVFELLFNAGVRTVIRAGTCGAMKTGVQAGAIIIAIGAIREDGTSPKIIPLEYPAIAECCVVEALEQAALDFDYKEIHTGLVLTSALFFTHSFIQSRKDTWINAGTIAVEMELAPLLVLARIYGAKAGGIFAVDNNVVDNPDPWNYDPNQEAVTRGKEAMLKIALSALAKL